MSADDAPCCAGCGGELGLEPIAVPAELTCHDCKHPLDAFPGEGGALFDCGQCGGQFVEHKRLLDMLETRETRAAAQPATATGKATEARPIMGLSPVRYIPCPTCRALMNRKHFGRTSGVIVDICKQHGTWFDAGELPRVLAFAANGGLARARAREAAERQAEKERLQRESRPPAAASFVAPSFEDVSGGAELAFAVLEIFAAIS